MDLLFKATVHAVADSIVYTFHSLIFSLVTKYQRKPRSIYCLYLFLFFSAVGWVMGIWCV